VGAKATYQPDFQKVAEQLCTEVTARDAVVVMGAGDVYRLFENLPLEK
jgi:UDP-N-acetylmuramate-alanine ligase